MRKHYHRRLLWPQVNLHYLTTFVLSLLIFSGTHHSVHARTRVKATQPAVVSLQFFDRAGKRLSAGKALDLLDGVKDNRKYATALVEPSTLQVMASGVVRKAGDDLVFDVPARPARLAVNFPTTRGYSLVILDNGGAGFSSPGTINFTYRAALDTRRRLDDALAARTDYARSESFRAAYARAVAHLNTASASASEPIRGQEGYLALDDLAEAYDILLAEYGVAYRKSHLGRLAPWMGTTLDDTTNYPVSLKVAKDTTEPHSWIRIVFNHDQQPGDYDDVVTAARQAGFKIIGAPIDSYAAARYVTTDAYLQRVKMFVDHFPAIEAWEVANEVNGEWLITKPGDLGRQQFEPLSAKVAAATDYVHGQGDKVVVTLYWQLTTGPEFTTFNWARANLPTPVRAKIDAVLLSAWVEDAPLGLGFDQVMGALQQEFPGKLIGLGELGYWGDGTAKAWWALDERNRELGRRRVAAQYYAAALGYEYSVGGGFWWYLYTDMVKNRDNDLKAAITTVTKGLTPSTL